MDKGCVLVTGGAGYIGSHTTLALVEAGWRPVVLDDLSTGQPLLVPAGVPLVVGDAGNQALVRRLIGDHRCTAAIHFAGSIIVSESFVEPLRYWGNNASVSRNLIEACTEAGLDKFIFSSTAAVYGNPDSVPIPETAALRPLSPYGSSKLATEWMLQQAAGAADLRYVALRYFNVAGADADLRAGQVSPVATHLIKVAAEAVVGKRAGVTIYGGDYDTADGTCVRDYIHVADLAQAHVQALDYLAAGGDSEIMNCGYGHGFSVREVLDMVRAVSGLDFPIGVGPRRRGDADILVADPARIRRVLGWRPGRDDLRAIVASALAWEQATRKRAGSPA